MSKMDQSTKLVCDVIMKLLSGQLLLPTLTLTPDSNGEVTVSGDEKSRLLMRLCLRAAAGRAAGRRKLLTQGGCECNNATSKVRDAAPMFHRGFLLIMMTLLCRHSGSRRM